jgi:predicted transcriptional regulator
MPKPGFSKLSRRERQIMDIVYRLGRVTAAEVAEALPDPPSYSAVRALLRILEDKGHVRHQEDGPRYVFVPTVPREAARATALDGLLATFFDGRPGLAAAALLDKGAADLSGEELDRLQLLIARARGEGR